MVGSHCLTPRPRQIHIPTGKYTCGKLHEAYCPQRNLAWGGGRGTPVLSWLGGGGNRLLSWPGGTPLLSSLGWGTPVPAGGYASPVLVRRYPCPGVLPWLELGYPPPPGWDWGTPLERTWDQRPWKEPGTENITFREFCERKKVGTLHPYQKIDSQLFTE